MRKIKRENIVTMVLLLAIAGTTCRFLLIFPNSNLVVGESEEITTTVNGVEYVFKKDESLLAISTNDHNLNPDASTHYHNNTISSPQEGETYPCLGINIKVLGTDDDKYVINVSPNN